MAVLDGLDGEESHQVKVLIVDAVYHLVHVHVVLLCRENEVDLSEEVSFHDVNVADIVV